MERNYQPKIIYPAKLSFSYERKIKAFPDMEKLRKFTTTRPALLKILKGVLLPEAKRQKDTKL